MQAEPAYMRSSTMKTFADVVRHEGALALYKGLLPPLIGSSIYRSVQFGVYSYFMTAMKDIQPVRFVLGNWMLMMVIKIALLTRTCL
jgi:hypothetical protein